MPPVVTSTKAPVMAAHQIASVCRPVGCRVFAGRPSRWKAPQDHRRLRKGTEGGFTLIELMIVVIIIGVLAAIAYPAYQKHVRKARRADATATLQQVATRMELYFANNKQYTNDLTQLGYATNPASSQEQYYNVSILPQTANCPTATCYVLNAVPPSSSPQISDTDCNPITLDSLNEKGPNGCW